MHLKKIKMSIIGAGNVGSTIAFSLITSGMASEIVIVDINKEKAIGEAMDLSHGISFIKPVEIYAGDYKDTEGSDIVIITAGMGQKPGETRLDLVQKNLAVFKSIIPELIKYSPDSILLVVSNPVDILTYITYKLSGFPSNRVIGSGTVLDTSRFKFLLGKHFNIDQRNIHSYIMGEHGDTEFAAWSLTSIAGMNIKEYCRLLCGNCEGFTELKVLDEVRGAAYEVIQRKGATNYAIALAIRRIIEAILRDENSILTVSSMLTGQYGINDIYMGVPSIIGANGINRILELPLNEDEQNSLKKSSTTLKELIEKLDI